MAQSQKRTVGKLIMLVFGMFGFAFALVPLYNLLCEVTGLNGKTAGVYVYEPATESVDESRVVRVNFITNTNENMPWKFWSERGGVEVHPGVLHSVNFFVTNTTDKVMVGQAVPSLSPGSAVEYFHKTECFCFERQVLQPGETMEMPMRFIVGAELPKHVTSLNLSYALFDVTDFVDLSTIESGRNPS